MNTDYIIHNEQIVSNKYLFLDQEFDIKKLVQPKPKAPYKSYQPQQKDKSKDKSKDKDYDSDYCDFIDNEECNFIDQPTSIIQNIVNNKTVKHTEFIRKYDIKYNKNTSTSTTKFKSFENNDNESCNFID